LVVRSLRRPDRGGQPWRSSKFACRTYPGQQADEEQFAKLIVHEHPHYQGPITLDVLPEELGELPDSEQYVSIEVIQPGERSGQRALLSVDRFNKLAAGGDMKVILLNAVAAQQPQRPPQPRRRGRGTKDDQARGKGTVEWGLPHRGRISPEEAAWVREHLLPRSSSCGQRAGCPCWIRLTPGPRSAMACRRLQPLLLRAPPPYDRWGDRLSRPSP
jgi:hypothetical protein